jgi:pyrimidine-nucleoside phosphorylase
MNPVELIQKKRDGGELSRDELSFMVLSYTRQSIPDYQMSAFLMACTIRGMTDGEMHDLTDVMLRSGSIIDLSDIPGVKVDKHSTGGVGDKLSILIAPIVASYGIPVPMISGRGLGHTGGTLDKLETIPGFRTDLNVREYADVVRRVGAVLIGQTNDIAPADKRMYALRDVTGTVECIPLIASSIMSKKLAAGIDALVLDVKVGNGALMQDLERATALATALVSIGKQAGKRTLAYITDMNQPIGASVGNWVEIRECVDCLRGERGPLVEDLLELTHLFAGTMIWLGGKAGSVDEGIEMSRASIGSGQAFAKFEEIVAAQGGNPHALLSDTIYPPPLHIVNVQSLQKGFIRSINAREIGLVSVQLGAGRMSLDDTIDPASGIVMHAKVGTSVNIGDTLARVYSNEEQGARPSVERVRRAFVIGPDRPEPIDLVKRIID